MQRLDPDFAVKGIWPRSPATPGSIFFEKDDATITSGVEIGKFAALAGKPLSSVTLKGFASEEEAGRPALIKARLDAVAAQLMTLFPGTGAPTKVSDLASGVGQVDYRSVRRVEILVAGAASSVPNCSAGADIACGPSPNPFDTGFAAAATKLLPGAFTALNKPNDPPAKDALKLFGGAAQAPKVTANLIKIAAHMPFMLPVIPLNDPTAPGHRCINSCEGDVLAYNQGVGASSRMTLGPGYLRITDPIRQGLVLIHEGSHGAAGLTTDDNAYDWQRLLPFLTPAAALKNADSLTRFVELIHNPSAPSKAQTDTASALPAANRKPALEALAWLEQWLVQGRLEVRSLYGAAARANKSGAWAPDDGFYRDNTMKHVAARFGVTAPPAVPKDDDKAAIAGIFDRLFQLRMAVTGSGRTFKLGPSPSVWDPGPGPNIIVSTGFLALGKKAKVERLLVMAVDAAPFIQSGRRGAYVNLVKDMSGGFGGP